MSKSSEKKRNRGSVWIWLASGIVGFFVFVTVLNRIYPFRGANIRIDRNSAVSKASIFMEDQGHIPEGYKVAVYLIHDAEAFTYLQKQYGYEAAQAMMQHKKNHGINFQWLVHFYRDLPKNAPQERFWVAISSSGEVSGFDHEIPVTMDWPRSGRANLSQEEALQIAQEFIRHYEIGMVEFQKHLFTSQALEKRTDHIFRWRKYSMYNESFVEMRILVKGDEVGHFGVNFHPPDAETTAIKQESGRAYFFTNVISIALFFFIGLVILVVFLKKYHEGEVDVRTGSRLFLVLWAAFFVQALLKFTLNAEGVTLGELSESGVALFVFMLFFLIVRPLLSLFGFAAWSSGESLGREDFPDKFTALDGIFNGKWFTLAYGRSALYGYVGGFLILGIAISLYRLGMSADGTLTISAYRTLLPVRGGFLLPVFIALSNSLLSEMVYRLFGNLFLYRLIRVKWICVLITAALWSLFILAFWGFTISLTPIYFEVLIWFLIGILLGILFWRFDILTVLIANFVVQGVIHSIPFLTSASRPLFLEGLVSIALVGVPLLIGFVALIRKESFVYQGPAVPAHIRKITERVRMSKELEIARQVQMRLLPKQKPIVPGFEIAGSCIPAKEVGGDYFDFIELNEHRLGIVIGDVSGKGVPAAIYMTLTKGIVQSHADGDVSPKDVLIKINNLLYRTIDRSSFVSLFYAVLDTRDHSLVFARAGHNPLLYLKKRDGKCRLIEPNGIALGLEPGEKFDSVIREERIVLEHGDLMVFYTDGFTEAMNRDREEYGEKRLMACVLRNSEESVDSLFDAVLEDVRKFTKDAPQHDDMTMVFLKQV